MEKIIQSLINNWIRGVDTYTHCGSTWLIFTDKKKWVIELTEDKTLWYNYNFFKQIFEFTSLNVVENQSYITKWVEDNVINKVSDIHFRDARDKKQQFDDTLENGVKKTYLSENSLSKGIEYTIENGVKETTALDPSFSVRYINGDFEMVPEVDKIIKSGVKETKSDDFNVSQFLCEEVIDKGVKETKISPTSSEYGDWLDGDEKLDEIIKNGVKETLRASYLNIDNVIQDGVKETKYNQSHQEPKFKEVLKNGVKRTFDCDWPVPTDLIEDVINDGVKDTKVCNYTDPETQIMTIKWGHCIDEVIENGVKETIDCDWADPNQIDEVIDNGEKINGTYAGGNRQKENIDSVIGYGTKN